MTRVRVLLTGARGFVGRQLSVTLRQYGHEVIAGEGNARFDVTDLNAVRSVVGAVTPEAIIHLAAVSSVGSSWKQPELTLHTNIHGTLNILQAVRELVPGCRIISVGSAEEYGRGVMADPVEYSHRGVRETCPCEPVNPYGISKLAAGELVLMAARSWRLDAVHVRAFNHIGPGQPSGYVVPDFCRQLAVAEANNQSAVLRVGDVSVIRDFLDVKDVASAYAALLTVGQAGTVFNVASGKGRALHEVLAVLQDIARVPLSWETDPELMRPADVPVLIGDSERLKQCTGWQPVIPLHQSIADVLAFWRANVLPPN